MINVGIIGYGYWGPNIVRNFFALKGVNVQIICDSDEHKLAEAREHYPFVPLTPHAKDVLENPAIDVVAIVTPVSSHYALAREALNNGKHIFIEKPFTATSEQALELIELAESKRLTIMVDHTFIFTGAVQRIKDLIDQDTLGKLYYYDSTRVSLGLFQHDVNVIWDLAPHDFSIIDYIVNDKPRALCVQGADHVHSGQENMAYITLYFEHNFMAHINVNWLSPVKIRTTLIGGQKKMLVWDDLQTDEKIKIYDKGVSKETKEGSYRLRVDYRAGDMWAPRVEHVEALRRELEYFVHCLEHNERPVNDGRAGYRVVRLLELCDESLKNNGQRIAIPSEWEKSPQTPLAL